MIPGTYANRTHPISDSPRRGLPLSECNCKQFAYIGLRVPLLNDASSLDITLLGVPTGRHPISLYFLPRVEATGHAELMPRTLPAKDMAKLSHPRIRAVPRCRGQAMVPGPDYHSPQPPHTPSPTILDSCRFENLVFTHLLRVREE